MTSGRPAEDPATSAPLGTATGPRIAVTGSTGFLGQHVIAALRASGAEVVEIVRPGRTRPGPRAGDDAALLVEADLDDPPHDLLQRCGDPETLLHLAWGRLDDYRSPEHLRTELPRHTRFLTRLLQQGQPRVVVAGTCFEYGHAEGRISESQKIAPVTEYSTAKARLHSALHGVAEQHDASLLWLRLFYVHGQGQPSRALWGQFRTAVENRDATFPMSPGHKTRDYLPIGRMTEHIARLTTIPTTGRMTTNVCSGEPVLLHDLVRGWIATEGIEMELEFSRPDASHEPQHVWGDATRLHELLAAGRAATAPHTSPPEITVRADAPRSPPAEGALGHDRTER